MFLNATAGESNRRGAGEDAEGPGERRERRSIVLGVVNPATVETVFAVQLEVDTENIFAPGRFPGKRLGVVVALPIYGKSRNVGLGIELQHFLHLGEYCLLRG